MPLTPITTGLDAVPSWDSWRLLDHLRGTSPLAYTFTWHDEFHCWEKHADLIVVEFPNLFSWFVYPHEIIPADPDPLHALDTATRELILGTQQNGRAGFDRFCGELLACAGWAALVRYALRGAGRTEAELPTRVFGADPNYVADLLTKLPTLPLS